MGRRFWNNQHFEQYESLLRRLHPLMAAGEGDTDEADAVRDEMDKPWRELSREEIARLDGLSADLYMLEGDEVAEPCHADDRTPERLRAELKAARDRGDWETVLALLRKGPTFIAADQIAFLRARAYEALGHLEASRLFMEHAAELNPCESLYKSQLIEQLSRLERHDEAVGRADS